MSTGSPIPDPQELIELYVAGAVTDAERTLVEQRLRAGDPDCLAVYERLRVVAERCFEAIAAVAPSPEVRAAVADRIGTERDAAGRAGAARAPSPAFAALAGAEPDPVADDAARMVLLRAGELDWRETGVPGVQCRNLFVDREANRLTLLIRMAPGATYPDHEHPGVEECLVLEGDLSIAGTVMHRMDYLRTPAGGLHGEPRTEQGCLLLVTCPLDSAA